MDLFVAAFSLAPATKIWTPATSPGLKKVIFRADYLRAGRRPAGKRLRHSDQGPPAACPSAARDLRLRRRFPQLRTAAAEHQLRANADRLRVGWIQARTDRPDVLGRAAECNPARRFRHGPRRRIA